MFKIVKNLLLKIEMIFYKIKIKSNKLKIFSLKFNFFKKINKIK